MKRDVQSSEFPVAASERGAAAGPGPRANGRPTRARASEIQDAIFAAALAEFLERGFHGGSIAGIATRANVTRATIYNHFNSKEAVLKQLNRRAAERLRSALEEVINPDRPVWEVLQDVGRCFYNEDVSADSISVSRILITEAERFPDLVAKGHELRWYCLEPLSEYFEMLSMTGSLALDDAPRAAQQFMHLVTSSVDYLFDPVTSIKERERWISSAVRIFLHGALRRT